VIAEKMAPPASNPWPTIVTPHGSDRRDAWMAAFELIEGVLVPPMSDYERLGVAIPAGFAGLHKFLPLMTAGAVRV